MVRTFRQLKDRGRPVCCSERIVENFVIHKGTVDEMGKSSRRSRLAWTSREAQLKDRATFQGMVQLKDRV